MGRDDRDAGRRGLGDKQQKGTAPRGGGGGSRPQPRYGNRPGAADMGRSGYGSESVRPYLRAQLRLKELLAGPPDYQWTNKPGRNGRGRRGGEGDD